MELKGEVQEETVKFETAVDMDIDAHIPSSYIKSEFQKLEMYKRIAEIENDEEKLDIQDELNDRFGRYPEAVANLIEIALLKAMAHKVYVTQLIYRKDRSFLKDKKPQNMVILKLYENAPFDITKIPLFLEGEGKRLKFESVGKPYFSYRLRDDDELLVRIKELLGKMEVLLPERETGDEKKKHD